MVTTLAPSKRRGEGNVWGGVRRSHPPSSNHTGGRYRPEKKFCRDPPGRPNRAPTQTPRRACTFQPNRKNFAKCRWELPPEYALRPAKAAGAELSRAGSAHEQRGYRSVMAFWNRNEASLFRGTRAQRDSRRAAKSAEFLSSFEEHAQNSPVAATYIISGGLGLGSREVC
jgi:hypothetical protein